MPLPQINATLTDVSTPGTSADWDDAEGFRVSKWGGDLGAYVMETRTRTESMTGGVSYSLSRVMIVPRDLPVLIERGDLLTFIFGGYVEVARADVVQRREPPAGVDMRVVTTRVTLAPALDIATPD